MYNPNDFLTPEMRASFDKAQELTGSDYQMAISAKDADKENEVSLFVSGDEKSIAFFDACKKQGVIGRIEGDKIGFQEIGNGYWLVYATAFVYIDDVLRGSATVSQSFSSNGWDIDRATQLATGLAKSKALSNAGFGICSFYVTKVPGNQPGAAPELENVLTGLDTLNAPASEPPKFYPGHYPPIPATPPIPAEEAPQCSTPAAAASTGSNVGAVPNSTPNADPAVDLAKTVTVPSQRKTLGEILDTNPKLICSSLEKGMFRGKIKDAAALLYREACRRCGVAPQTNLP